MQLSAPDRVAAPRLRRSMAAGVASLVLLLAACGGGDDAEVSVVGDDLTGSSEQTDATPETPDEPIELDAGERDRTGEAPVPDAAIPDAPAPESSPAERQRLQELGLTPQRDGGAVERLPIPEEDLDDIVVPIPPIDGEAQAPTRDDLDQFPASIPLLPGATLDRAGDDPASAGNGAFAIVEPPPSDLAAVEGANAASEVLLDLETGRPIVSGVVVPDVASVPAASDPEAPAPDEAADVCAGEGTCIDGVPVDPLAGPAELPSDGTRPAVPTAPVDCETTPWGRGCDGPPIEDGVAGEIDDPNADPGEGVEVPQEIVDLLLTPGDNESD